MKPLTKALEAELKFLRLEVDRAHDDLFSVEPSESAKITFHTKRQNLNEFTARLRKKGYRI